MRTLVVIPTAGAPGRAAALVLQLAAEPCAILVVDAAGTYRPQGDERVRRAAPGDGWLGATNVGLAAAFDRGEYEHCLVLNDDVRLSRRFVRGLEVGADAGPDVALVGPLADDVDLGNGQYFAFDPGAFVPYPELLPAPFVHGSGWLWTRAGYHAIGPLDAAQQPYGWGVDVEAGYLAHRAGLRVLISKYSHMKHERSATIRTHGVDVAEYEARARAHTAAILRRKYGPGWRDLLEFDFGVPP